MGLIKLLFHGKEINELEETLKLLLDKIRSIYNKKGVGTISVLPYTLVFALPLEWIKQ